MNLRAALVHEEWSEPREENGQGVGVPQSRVQAAEGVRGDCCPVDDAEHMSQVSWGEQESEEGAKELGRDKEGAKELGGDEEGARRMNLGALPGVEFQDKANPSCLLDNYFDDDDLKV